MNGCVICDTEKREKVNLFKKIYGVDKLKIIFTALSFIAVIISAFIETRHEYLGIVTLPICFLIVCLLFDFKKNVNGIGTLIICAMYFLRHTFFPVIVVLGNYNVDVNLNFIISYINYACLLMNIEMFIVFAALSIKGIFHKRKFQIKKNKQVIDFNFSNKKTNVILYFFILILLVFNIFVYFTYKDLFTAYWKIAFITNNQTFVEALEKVSSGIPGYIYYPFKLCAEVLKILVIALALIKVTNHKHLNNLIKWILYLIIAFIAIMIMSSEQINSIILGFCICYYILIKNIDKGKRLILFFLVLVFVGFLFVMFFIADVTDISGMGRILNNYFNGPLNISYALYYIENIHVDKGMFLTDLLSAIPYVEGITETISLNTVITEYFKIPGAIVPLTAYGYALFGKLFFFVPALIVTVFTCFFDYISEKTNNDLIRIWFLYIAVHSGMAIGMYNINIYYSLTVYEFILPCFIYLISCIISHRRVYIYGENNISQRLR